MWEVRAPQKKPGQLLRIPRGRPAGAALTLVLTGNFSGKARDMSE